MIVSGLESLASAVPSSSGYQSDAFTDAINTSKPHVAIKDTFKKITEIDRAGENMELNRVGDTSGGLLVGWVARYDFDFSEPLSPRLPTHQMHPRRSSQQPQWTSSPIWKGTWVLVRARRTDGRATGLRINRNVSWPAKSR
jgi:hypothetical protein